MVISEARSTPIRSVLGCSCDKFVETYAEEGPFSIDLYATMGPVRRVDYSNSCSHVKVSCSVVPDNWDSDVWAVFNGTMKSMITASSRIFCDEKSATWQVDLKTGERTIWAGVSVYCQSYRSRWMNKFDNWNTLKMRGTEMRGIREIFEKPASWAI